MEVRDIARSIVNRTGEFGGNVQELAKNILDKQRQRQEFFNQNPEAQKAVNRMKPPMQRAVEFIGKNYLYNPEDKKLFPSSPVHTIQDMMNIQQQRQSGELSEQEARKQLSDKALNMAMVVGELSPSPKAVNNQAARALKMLEEQAKQYDSFDDFVKAQDLYHGTPNKIEGGVLKFGAGDQLKKGGYMGGHFLTDTPEIAEGFSFGGDVYQASGDLKNKVLDVNKNKELFEDFIGKEYVSDGEKVKFTRQAFDYMFPDGKADWSTIDTDLAEQMAKKLGKIGIAIPEYAAGKQGMTYQIFEDNIPVYTKDQLKNIYNKATQPQLSDDLIKEAQKYKSAEEFVKAQEAPKTVTVWNKSKFSNEGAYIERPVIRKVEGKTLYQGGDDSRQFWTPDKKYAEQFGDVKEKTGTFYQIDNGNRMTEVYVDASKTKSQLTDIWNKAMSEVKGK